ncbi:MAG: RNA 3'-terminal phosphate cyclase [Sedimentisphaerales bacterium]
MLTIDGSYGEGGGQILRTAVSYSVYTHTPIEITNIRAKRPIPGLRPQHFTAISCLQAICNAEVTGLAVGSKTIRFSPGAVRPGDYTFDIGTAGNITLIFQACLLGALQTPGPLTITIAGGTDVLWAPAWDYFAKVFVPLLHHMGVNADVQLIQRGYYPKGGGKAVLRMNPTADLQPFMVDTPQRFKEIEGLIHLSGLPEHIATRMKHAALKDATAAGLDARIAVEQVSSRSQGVGITVWASTDKTILGSGVLGECQVSAEQVGHRAISRLVSDIQAGATLDPYAVDQLLPYMVACQRESRCLIRECSSHMKTNIWVLQQFQPRRMEVTSQGDLWRIVVGAAGL